MGYRTSQRILRRIKKVENYLRFCLDEAKRLGFKITDQCSLDFQKKRCCPSGAVRLKTGTDSKIALRISSIFPFVFGFDGDEPESYQSYKFAEANLLFFLGKKFRKEFLKK